MSKKIRDDGKEKISKHFIREEFWCRCCHSVGTDPSLTSKVLAIADAIRDKLGKPLHCESGYRCEKHNKEVGGVPNSWHKRGGAMDIHCPGVSVDKLASVAEQCGAQGLGKYYSKQFVHIDVGHKQEWIER